MRSKWYSFLGDDIVESSDDDQDSLKVGFQSTSSAFIVFFGSTSDLSSLTRIRSPYCVSTTRLGDGSAVK